MRKRNQSQKSSARPHTKNFGVGAWDRLLAHVRNDDKRINEALRRMRELNKLFETNNGGKECQQ